jgi:hypothetical protein
MKKRAQKLDEANVKHRYNDAQPLKFANKRLHRSPARHLDCSGMAGVQGKKNAKDRIVANYRISKQILDLAGFLVLDCTRHGTAIPPSTPRTFETTKA